MELKLYNTLTRQKAPFRPLDPTNVRMYVCGPTVYDFAHIGNARPVIVFDVLFRLLRHLYGPEHVTYVRNITDVDDKINARAAQEIEKRGGAGANLNAEIRRLTDQTYANFKQDVAALGCLPPTHEPRATEYVRRTDGKLDMIGLIERLIANGNAYVTQGHVLFDVPSMPDYGRLARRSLDEMIAGARVDVAPYKKNPMDFVLWKPSSADEPGWDSPWGRGRPGWHIECSAMSGALLGETFDIHGGGIDLVFPHHENEIAQSRCAFHAPLMAQVWMHNGFLQVEGEKMAKSVGNFVTIRELLRGWNGEPWTGPTIRMAMLGTHYHQPIDWTRDRLAEAKAFLAMFARATSRRSISDEMDYQFAWKEHPEPSATLRDALADDLNTPLAIGSIRERIANCEKLQAWERNELVHDVRFLGLVQESQRDWLIGSMGMFQMPPELVDQASILFRDYRVFSANNDPQMIINTGAALASIGVRIRDTYGIEYSGTNTSARSIENLIEERNAARKAKNFAVADRIRDELAAMGVVLKDSKDPQTGEQKTTWEIAR